MFGLGMPELIIVGIIAVLLFGKRLPEVAKSLGKSYTEFRRGLADIQSQINMSDIYSTTSNSSSYTTSKTSYDYDDYEAASAPKFDPPPAEPQPESSSSGVTDASPGMAADASPAMAADVNSGSAGDATPDATPDADRPPQRPE